MSYLRPVRPSHSCMAQAYSISPVFGCCHGVGEGRLGVKAILGPFGDPGKQASDSSLGCTLREADVDGPLVFAHLSVLLLLLRLRVPCLPPSLP